MLLLQDAAEGEVNVAVPAVVIAEAQAVMEAAHLDGVPDDRVDHRHRVIHQVRPLPHALVPGQNAAWTRH